MKALIRALLLFTIAPLLWCAVMAAINVRKEKSEGTGIDARTVAFGDSHMGCSIDPRVLKGAANTALPAEPYLLSWYKLKHLSAQHRIDTVLLGFAPHNLSDKDHRKFHDNGWATERLMKRMYPLVPFREAMGLPLHRKTYLRTLFMRYCTWPQESHVTYIGHFSGLGAKFHADSVQALQRHFLEEDGAVAPISAYGIACLDSIVALCHRERMALYLIGSPLHESYRRGIPEAYLARYAALSARYESEAVHVIDRTALFAGDSLFANSDHLNGRGAKLFTRELQRVMRPTQDRTVVH
ncbi:MAG: hypothetical protein IPL52_01010 [Flavobacteriales bacterium]|nr:hypothetical protein [Flavobacteriales bacterium]